MIDQESSVPVKPEDFPDIPTEKMIEVWDQLDNAKKDWVLNTAKFMVNSQEFGGNVTEFIDTAARRLGNLFGRKEEKEV